MDIHKILTPALISLDLEGESKQEIIEELIDLLVAAGKLSDREAGITAIMEREAKMSTGIQSGVAIPHGKCRAVNELIACIGIKRDGADFESLDGIPSRIFIMTLSPVDRTGPHVQFLAGISQLLKSEEQRERLLSAANADEILGMLA